MCGICGKTRDPGGAAVGAMNAAMQHRGPDDEGVYLDPSSQLALGARRLSVIDVEHGHQPLSNEDGTVWAVMNGEIYNHPELQQRLRAGGHQLATLTDTEVLVHLYEDSGDDLVDQLEGMFAFAVWDAERERLLLGRDRFGEKPLFYSERDGELAFASELTALRAGTALGHELDPHAVDDYFVFGYVPGQRPILKGARELPPAHLLSWERSPRRTVARSYWAPKRTQPRPGANWIPLRQRRSHLSSETAAATGASSLLEIAQKTQALLESSIASRMIADVPLGVLLSGGLDSTLIAALAQRVSAHPVKTFTVGYDTGSVSEASAAREIARELGTEHHEVILSDADVAERVPKVLSSVDQPLADQAFAALHAVAELARTEVKVVIGGEGADELFGGYPRYAWLARARWLGNRVPQAVTTVGTEALRALPAGGRTALLANLLDSRRPLLERHVDWVTDGRRGMRAGLYGPRLRDAAAHRIEFETSLNGSGPTAFTTVAEFMLLDQVHWLPSDVLMKADRAGMLVSLEVRTPYLQRQLAEFAGAVSAETHAQGGGKMLLRLTLDQVLPGFGNRLRKTAFRVPSADWLRRPLAHTLADQLENGTLYAEGWIDRAAAKRLVDEHQSGRRDRSAVIWPLLALGLWLDRLRGREA
jgi:asparagine synthase (glutamine-hydrolysing)